MEIVVNATELKVEEDCLEDLKHAIACILPGSETRVEHGLLQLGKCLGALNSALQTLDRELVKIPGVDDEMMSKCEDAVLNFHQMKRKKLSQGMKVIDHNDNNLSLNSSNNIDNDNKKFAYHKIRSKVISLTKEKLNISSDNVKASIEANQAEEGNGLESFIQRLRDEGIHSAATASDLLNKRYQPGGYPPKYDFSSVPDSASCPIWTAVLTVPEGYTVTATGASKKEAKNAAALLMLGRLDTQFTHSNQKYNLNTFSNGNYIFNIHQPTAHPRWPSNQQLLIGPIHRDLDCATIRNVFILYGHIKQLYVSPWSEERKQKLGYIVYSQSGVVKMLLARGYVMVPIKPMSDIMVPIKQLEDLQSPLMELRQLQK